MRKLSLDVLVTRGQLTESRHRVHAAAVEASGTLVAAARDPLYVTYWRSCAKPFQVMPLVRSGGFDRVGWGDDELALSCGSHGGEPEHVAIAGSMLQSIGLEEGDLVCGPHEPLSPRGARLLRESGARSTRLHNNCSGKHAAMLARAHTAGWCQYGYERDEHQVQTAIHEEIASWTEVPASRIHRSIDGCGVVVYGLPLENMALAYARLAARANAGDEIPSRVMNAMRTRPFLMGGTERFDSAIIEETKGAVVAKVGAEGVHSVAVPAAGIGVVVKVEDGGVRAQHAAVLRLLQLLEILPEQLPARLAEFVCRPVKNTRGEVVGEVKPES